MRKNFRKKPSFKSIKAKKLRKLRERERCYADINKEIDAVHGEQTYLSADRTTCGRCDSRNLEVKYLDNSSDTGEVVCVDCGTYIRSYELG